MSGSTVSPMIRFPLRQRHVLKLGEIFVNGAGRFFLTDEPAAMRHQADNCTDDDGRFLEKHGHLASEVGSLAAISNQYQVAARNMVADRLNYLILVPTLRCNLSCSYCQVSRADEKQPGFDWSNETLGQVLAFIDGLETNSIKIEFQGGEPTLRLDLIEAVIERCARFDHAEFVICTNLSRVSDDLIALLARPDIFISTSLDGDRLVHEEQRTRSGGETDQFFSNLERVIAACGSSRVSALPTIDQVSPPDIDSLLDAYGGYGFSHIFLRPINYQGFARKRHPASRDDHRSWWDYYDAFIKRMIERNYANREHCFEETYLTLCLKRIFRLGVDGHVDLRNPNPVGVDYIVIDYDGAIYPTDEARMLTRSGVVDLRIGSLLDGYDSDIRQMLNSHSTTHGDPACDNCAYQPYCGRDLIDDLSRYGRIDTPRHQTFFCQKHMHIFDLCMRLIYSEDAAIQYSLAKWLGLSGDRLPAQATLL